ncbi:hypothetical protein ABZ801_02605 [Actinomadura sp. NPDC047616]|uniref:hypothetical protein n=1 Tax=Actinomadura sp. NPDC047616 TaxID=3155914 RepID=UPI0033E2AFFC
MRAASSLYHVADPDRMLGDVHAALRPGGLLVVIEMDALPRFLPDGAGLCFIKVPAHDARLAARTSPGLGERDIASRSAR